MKNLNQSRNGLNMNQRVILLWHLSKKLRKIFSKNNSPRELWKLLQKMNVIGYIASNLPIDISDANKINNYFAFIVQANDQPCLVRIEFYARNCNNNNLSSDFF